MLNHQQTLSERLMSEVLQRGSACCSVYSLNAQGAKLNALAATYPVAVMVLGEACFNQCAMAYCDAYPLADNDLNVFGNLFPGFMAALCARRADLQQLVYLPDLCGFEWALHRAYYAPQAGDVIRLVAQYNVKDLWEAHQQEDIDGALSRFELSEGVYRYQFN